MQVGQQNDLPTCEVTKSQTIILLMQISVSTWFSLNLCNQHMAMFSIFTSPMFAYFIFLNSFIWLYCFSVWAAWKLLCFENVQSWTEMSLCALPWGQTKIQIFTEHEMNINEMIYFYPPHLG